MLLYWETTGTHISLKSIQDMSLQLRDNSTLVNINLHVLNQEWSDGMSIDILYAFQRILAIFSVN